MDYDLNLTVGFTTSNNGGFIFEIEDPMTYAEDEETLIDYLVNELEKQDKIIVESHDITNLKLDSCNLPSVFNIETLDDFYNVMDEFNIIESNAPVGLDVDVYISYCEGLNYFAEAKDCLENFYGAFDSAQDFVEYEMQMMSTDIPSFLRHAIDFGVAARELLHDYVDVGDDNYILFRNN